MHVWFQRAFQDYRFLGRYLFGSCKMTMTDRYCRDCMYESGYLSHCLQVKKYMTAKRQQMQLDLLAAALIYISHNSGLGF